MKDHEFTIDKILKKEFPSLLLQFTNGEIKRWDATQLDESDILRTIYDRKDVFDSAEVTSDGQTIYFIDGAGYDEKKFEEFVNCDYFYDTGY
jgi:hypothetical protein